MVLRRSFRFVEYFFVILVFSKSAGSVLRDRKAFSKGQHSVHGEPPVSTQNLGPGRLIQSVGLKPGLGFTDGLVRPTFGIFGSPLNQKADSVDTKESSTTSNSDGEHKEQKLHSAWFNDDSNESLTSMFKEKFAEDNILKK